MCKVYEFPKRLELPQEEAEILELLGEAYTKALYRSLEQLLSPDDPIEEMEGVTRLVNDAFTKGMTKAISQLEKS